MSYCGKCGKELVGKGNFCPGCGAKVKETGTGDYQTGFGNQYIYASKKMTALYIIVLVLAAIFLIGGMARLSACGSSEPCESCGDTPTKAYTNNYSGEKEYYCTDCSSECEFCPDKATEHYTSGLGMIIFACKDCYKEIQELNQ